MGHTMKILAVRKSAICICEIKGVYQWRGNRAGDQRFCFPFKDSAIPLLSKPEIASLSLSSEAIQPVFCPTQSETPKTGFLLTQLKCYVTIAITCMED